MISKKKKFKKISTITVDDSRTKDDVDVVGTASTLTIATIKVVSY